MAGLQALLQMGRREGNVILDSYKKAMYHNSGVYDDSLAEDSATIQAAE